MINKQIFFNGIDNCSIPLQKIMVFSYPEIFILALRNKRIVRDLKNTLKKT